MLLGDGALEGQLSWEADEEEWGWDAGPQLAPRYQLQVEDFAISLDTIHPEFTVWIKVVLPLPLLLLLLLLLLLTNYLLTTY